MKSMRPRSLHFRYNPALPEPQGEGKLRKIVWLRIGLLVLVALALLPFVVGLFLPESYDARIQFTLSRPPEDVWAAISNPEKHPMTGQMMKQVTRRPDENGLPVWVEDMGSSQITVKVVEATPPTHQKRQVKDSVVPMTAEWTFHIEKTEGGSRITATNHTVIRSGTWHVPLFRFIMTLTKGAEMGLKDYWSGVAREFGETPSFASP